MNIQKQKLLIGSLYLTAALSGSAFTYGMFDIYNTAMSVKGDYFSNKDKLSKVNDDIYNLIFKNPVKNPETIDKVKDLISKKGSLEYKINRFENSVEFKKENIDNTIKSMVYVLFFFGFLSSGLGIWGIKDN